MDKNIIKSMINEINEALKVVGDKNGYNLSVGSCNYSDIELNFKVNGKVKVANNGKSGEQANYEKLCLFYGMPLDGFGKTFNYQGREFRVSGLTPRNTKYNVLAIDVKTGKQYKLVGADVVRSLSQM